MLSRRAEQAVLCLMRMLLVFPALGAQRALRKVRSIVAGEAQKADDMQEACLQQLVPDVYMRQ